MQRFKHNAKKYTLLSCVFLFLFLFLWFYYCYSFIDLPNQSDVLIKFTDKDILVNLFSGNYQGYKFIALLSLPFAFAVNYLISNENPQIILRMKNRGEYVKYCTFHIIVFSAIFSFLHEAVNMICISCFYSNDLILELKLPAYTLINFLTLFIYFSRMGGLFLLIRFCVNPKFAPFLLLVLYFIEFHISAFINIYFPINDSIVIFELILGTADIVDVIALSIRGVSLIIIVFIAVYFKFQKKDILRYEKQ